jgi:hypothetical protein
MDLPGVAKEEAGPGAGVEGAVVGNLGTWGGPKGPVNWEEEGECVAGNLGNWGVLREGEGAGVKGKVGWKREGVICGVRGVEGKLDVFWEMEGEGDGEES